MPSISYHRRPTMEVAVGNTAIGGSNPLRLQSMTSTSTMDTEASIAQAKRIADAGADIVRLTAQGVREAANLTPIRDGLRRLGCDIPLVADIHFNPRAALEAAARVEKVRINPGNFADPGRTFKKIEYTDDEYAAERAKIKEALRPLIDICKANDTALRIGVNHGSLSDRIMSRYGDTPAGMVESAMEYLRACRELGFERIVVSIKASNVGVMTQTVRLMAVAMDAEGMHYPLHLGVTEAGDGEDGRVKSAVGIGSLLADGLGDTIRVSLSEEPEDELPVARAIAAHIATIASAPAFNGPAIAKPTAKSEPTAITVGGHGVFLVGGDNIPVVAASERNAEYPEGRCPDIFASMADNILSLTAEEILSDLPEVSPAMVIALSSSHPNRPAHLRAAIIALREAMVYNPVIIKAVADGGSADEATVWLCIDLGGLFLDRLADGLWIEPGSGISSPADATRLAFAILQATRSRITSTEYISCPSCGRTLFDLQTTLAKVKEATKGLKGLKIGVMGCIVNGPGEMADADYGYVGAAAGCVSLYKGKVCIIKNIPQEEAVDRLVALIKENGDWK
ncbi:MAG: (E)-4-hydroxy-3-methylbut-2-enyl-diphosphate synthase [Pseudoflavonifractor sp.]|nr:(E)-4-hydroxy-3-methylbut-2-enyl-diphosphate synthase [Alloprevotella sp.]MCM1116506.1 (E)-4-hydroxy-3-methylbut-2-enyl-diphosphate synthase [Pseudoflavonifractor sp.]